MPAKGKLLGDDVKLWNKAYVVENKAVEAYVKGVKLFKAFGTWEEGLEQVIRWIAVETIFHKHIVEALLKAQSEADKLLADEGRKEEPKATPEGLKIVAEFAMQHLKIEKDMIDTYSKIAEVAKHPLIRQLALALAENEMEHHAKLAKIVKMAKKRD